MQVYELEFCKQSVEQAARNDSTRFATVYFMILDILYVFTLHLDRLYLLSTYELHIN